MKIALIILTVLYYVSLLILAFFAVSNANTAAKYAKIANEYAMVEEKIDTEFKVFLDTISFGIYDGGEEKQTAIEQAVSQMNLHKDSLNLLTWILLGMAGILIVISWFYFRQFIFQHLLVLSIIALVVGLATPVLSFIAYQDLPVLGQVVFRYDSKGILGTINKLFLSKNFFVAAMLLLFSVIVPFLKLGFSFFILIDKNSQRVDSISKFIHDIGKWSMLDVFVVAVFLTLFALGQDGLTDARAGIGLYYFASYVLFSLLASQIKEN